MATTAENQRPDVHEMVVVHRIFRQGFAELADLARRVPAGDTAWASAVADETEFLLSALHHHHTAEDEHLWPLLVERSEPDAELVGRMAAQHEAVAQAVDRSRSVLGPWRTAPGGPELADALDAVTAALVPHLDEEEAGILPICRRCVTQAEWQAMGDAAFAEFSNDEKFVALGWMLASATPEESEAFVARLPWVVRAMWSLMGRRRFESRMTRLRGGSDVAGTWP